MMSKKEGRTMRRNIGKKPWLYPLPVLIIGTCDENGVPDAMNAACGGLCTSNMIEFRALGCFLRFLRFENLRQRPIDLCAAA